MHSSGICAIPIRLAVGVMSFLICFIAYMLRANIAIGLLAMVASNKTEPDYGPRYKWSDDEVSWIQGAFFAGSCITAFPSGFLAEWYGGKLTTTISLVLSLVMTALTPIMSDWSVWALYVNRLLVGVAGGVFYPALHNVVSKWAPPDEKGKFVAALLGGNLGTVFTFQLTGIVTEAYGWRSVFYGQGIIVLVITILWIVLVANTPRTHPFIGAKELQYIETSLGSTLSTEKKVPPYGQIFKSVPFISLLLLHYGNLWGLLFLLTIAPEYMKEALGFNMKNSGIYASLPHLARFLAGFVFGWIGDCLRRRTMSPTLMRKSFCLFSHVIPGLLLLAIPYMDESAMIITILTFSLGFNGAATLTNLQNSQDLAPNFAGTLYSIINFIGLSSGFFGPLVKNQLAQYGAIYNFNAWSVMFIIGGLGYIVPAVIFWFLGTADIQSWNQVSKLPIDSQESQVSQVSDPADSSAQPNMSKEEDIHTKC